MTTALANQLTIEMKKLAIQFQQIKDNSGNALDVADLVLGVLPSGNITSSSASTSGSVSVEPFVVATTLTGIGGVGGRAHFSLSTNVALGSWSNAVKAEVTYGASGRTTGLGSSINAEMTLSAGTSAGTYAPVEIELNLGSGALTGTATSLIYGSINGTAAATFDTNGYFLNLAGVTAGTAKMFMNVGTTTALADFVKGLRCKIAGTDYVIPLITAAEFAS